jgi:two-component system phosphate regulon response regulator PhoB
MSGKNILVVDDERDILELISYNLRKNGYDVTTALTGKEALQQIRNELPDLVVLDLMLPGIDGLDVCRLMKSEPRTSQVPIVMVTARGDEADVVTGLEMGADDYVTKPFSPRILLARIKALLRRLEAPEPQDGAVLVRGKLQIDPSRYEVRLGKERLDLTLSEFNILHHLVRRPGWVFTRSQIIDAIRGFDYAVTERAVDVLVVGLRKKLGESGTCIETVRGVGYRFRDS